MRYMMLMIPNIADEADWMPSAEAVAGMMKYNDALAKAGVMLSGEGLHPSSKGARVAFGAGRPTVTDGPFTEARELIGGYWLIDVKSKEEAVEWATRCPAEAGQVIELRQVFELSDFPEDVQAAAAPPAA